MSGNKELIKIFNIYENKIRTISKDEDIWFVAKDICNALKLKNPTVVVKRVSDTNKKKVNLRGLSGETYFINKSGLKQIIIGSKSHKAIFLAKHFGIDLQTSMVVTKEQETIAVISKTFCHLKQERQFFVDGYKIDLYFPNEKIAIECDEYAHKTFRNRRLYNNDINRQVYIENKLGCKFIRYNPDDEDFNIGTVINQIIIEVYENGRIADTLLNPIEIKKV